MIRCCRRQEPATVPCRAGECDLPAPAWPLFCSWVVSVIIPRVETAALQRPLATSFPCPMASAGHRVRPLALSQEDRRSQGIWMSRWTGLLGSHCPELSLPARAQPGLPGGPCLPTELAEQEQSRGRAPGAVACFSERGRPRNHAQGGDEPEPRGCIY